MQANATVQAMFSDFIVHFKEYLYMLADFSASVLELVGILIIIVGSFRALFRLFRCVIRRKPVHAIVDLGKVFLLALEFKMGAEIIKTVIIHNLEELAILVIVILIRTLLAFVVHWEIRTGKKENPLQGEREKESVQQEN